MQPTTAQRQRTSCRSMEPVRLLEERQQSLDVVRLLQEAFRVPLTVCCREEVASIHVDRPRKTPNRIDDGVDDVGPERHSLALAECFGSGSLDSATGIARWPPPKDVVFAARVDPYDSPHPMVVGELGTLWAPDEIENRELRRLVKHVDPCAPWLAQGMKKLCWSGNASGNDFEDTGRPTRCTSAPAVSSEAIGVEHNAPLLLQLADVCS